MRARVREPSDASCVVLSVRDRLIESWNDTNAFFVHEDVKRVSYLSLEYLMGRSMQNALLNMDLEDNYRCVVGSKGGLVACGGALKKRVIPPGLR